MKNLIKKILKEELDDGLDWVRDVPPFSLGKLLSGAEVCSDSNDVCDVNINFKDNEIVFVLDYEEWKNHFNLDDYVLEQLFIYGGRPNYQTHNLRGELDVGEVDYLNYHLSTEQEDRFNKILRVITNGQIKVSSLEDNFSDIEHYLLHPELRNLWESFIWDYLSPLEEALERNTWDDLTSYYDQLVKDTGVEIEVYNTGSYYSSREEIKITVPIKILSTRNLINLTEVVEEASNVFVEEDWIELANQNYDMSGAEEEVNKVINDFLGRVEDFLGDEEEMRPYQNFLEILKKLGFNSINQIYLDGLGRKNIYTKKMGENVYVGVAPKIDDSGENVYIFKQKQPFKKYGTNKPFYKNIVPIVDLGQYIYNRELEL